MLWNKYRNAAPLVFCCASASFYHVVNANSNVDTFNLRQRFVDAQVSNFQADCGQNALSCYRFVQKTEFAKALTEIRSGRKRGHWMWFAMRIELPHSR